MQSTGAVIEQTLPNFLSDGRWKTVDGSKYDERGAYCRLPQQMTFSTSGRDDAKVTVTPEPQPITSRQPRRYEAGLAWTQRRNSQ